MPNFGLADLYNFFWIWYDSMSSLIGKFPALLYEAEIQKKKREREREREREKKRGREREREQI